MSHPPPGSRLLAAADGVCDIACLGFAAWTLLCHVTVFLGGSLHHLLTASAVTAALVSAGWVLRRRLRPSEPPGLVSTPQAVAPRRLPSWVTATGAAVGYALALALAAGVDPLRLWAPATLYLLAAAVLALRYAPDPALWPASRASAVALWALAVAAALLTASLCRPDADDALYVSMAVAAADAPSAPLLAGDPLHGVPGVRLDFPTYRLHTFEVLAGAAAYLTGVEAIAWLHLALPPLLAAISVLAIGRATRRLAPSRWLWVTAAVVTLLVGVGNAHNWYGNMAFVRLHQGKGALVTVLLPLLLAYGLELADTPGRGTCMRLSAATIAAIGMNATALWLAPAVALPAVIAALPADRRAARAAVLAGLASLYPLLLGTGFALAIRHTDQPLRPYLLGMETSKPAGHTGVSTEAPPSSAGTSPVVDTSPPVPPELAHMVARIFLDARLAVPCAIVLLCGWWLSPEPLVRRLHLVFAVVGVTVLANPHLIAWTAANVTGTHTSWRLLWVLPLPLLLALALTSPAAWWPRRLGVVLSLLLLAGFVALVSKVTVLSTANGTRIRPFHLKAPPELDVARALAAVVPPGAVVVTPLDVAPWLTTLHHHPHPLVVRSRYLQPLRETLGTEEVDRRRNLVWLVSLPRATPAQLRRLLAGLENFEVEGVCFRSSVAHRHLLTSGLIRLGFLSCGSIGEYDVWARTLPPMQSPHKRNN